MEPAKTRAPLTMGIFRPSNTRYGVSNKVAAIASSPFETPAREAKPRRAITQMA